MPTLTVKNIPQELYEQLKFQAELNHRSLNREIIVCIEKAVRSERLPLERVLLRARALREKTAQYPIDDQDFTNAKREGRL